jgi:isopenicillin-N epimerase
MLHAQNLERSWELMLMILFSCVFVPNATAGVNAVLRSLSFQPGDELLTTNHAYNACKNALHFAGDRNGVKVAVATVPFPTANSDEIAAAVLNAVTPRTKLLLLDHVTSPTALVFPVTQIVSELARRGIDTLIDGAHAPGMIPLNISAIGAAYYTGNCHKWVCAPKGAGFLYVRPDKQSAIRPLSISHGANSTRTDCSRFQIEFNWTGTDDVSPYLCVPWALRQMASLVQGGWPEVMHRNHELAIKGREVLCRSLGVAPPCPAELLGSMATLPLPGNGEGPPNLLGTDPLQDELLFKHGIEVPIVGWNNPPRMLRISAQLYNQDSDYEKLAAALKI